MEKLGLSVKGLKADLQERLLGHYELDFSDARVNADDHLSSVGSVVSDAVGDVVGNVAVGVMVSPAQKSMYTLKDLEDGLSTFDGTNSPDVDQWISEFEEMAEIVQWTSLQMFVYGRQLLVGAAKIYAAEN